MVKKVALKPKIIYNKYIHIVPSYLNVLIIYQEEGDFEKFLEKNEKIPSYLNLRFFNVYLKV